MSFSPRVFPRTLSIHPQISPFARPYIFHRRLHEDTAKMTVQRITMFKVANEADIPQFFEQYKTLSQNQKKVRQAIYQLYGVESRG